MILEIDDCGNWQKDLRRRLIIPKIAIPRKSDLLDQHDNLSKRIHEMIVNGYCIFYPYFATYSSFI